MLESVLAFFALGAIGFWLALVAVFVLLCVFSEEDGGRATLTFVLGVLFLQFLAKVDVFHYVKGNPLHFAFYAGIYILAGLAWSVLKWWRYVAKQHRIYNEAKKLFCEQFELDPSQPLSLEMKERWADWLPSHSRTHYRGESHVPQVTEHKADIIRWMTYWPFSFVWTLLNDPIRRFYEFVYDQVGVKMQKVADLMFKNTKQDFLTKEETEELRKRRGVTDSAPGRSAK